MANHMGAGRPPKYTSARAMQAAIDEYFAECEGELLKDAEGNPMVDKSGQPIMLGAKPPTTSGLAFHLGFADKSSLYDYESRDKFRWTIRRARLRIQKYTEERLFDKNGSAGARFSLQNNFDGWKTEAEVTMNTAEQAEVLNEIERRMSASAEAVQ